MDTAAIAQVNQMGRHAGRAYRIKATSHAANALPGRDRGYFNEATEGAWGFRSIHATTSGSRLVRMSAL